MGRRSWTENLGAGHNPGQSWSIYTGFIVDAGGRPVIDDNHRWIPAFDPNLTGGNGGLYFGGTNAMIAYGKRVPLYTPTPWEPGSAVSHLDDDTFTGADRQLMDAKAGGPGLNVRVLSPFEIGIMQDLGYDMVPVTAGPTPFTASSVVLSSVL